MAETDLHRDLMVKLIHTLQAWFGPDELVYVSGNLLVFYYPGDRRRHLSPDVFVVKGVPGHRRDNYLIWEEGKGPDFVIELTSASTRDEDVDDKMWLYRDVLKVHEYFLFDPNGEHLDPVLQGYRLYEGDYVAIEPVENRLPSDVLGLHLERYGRWVRLYNPETGEHVPSPEDVAARDAEARRLAEQQVKRLEAEYRQAEAARKKAERAQKKVEAENERLRRELEELRRGGQPPGE